MRWLVFIPVFVLACYAQEYAIVSNGSITSLSKQEIRALYLSKINTKNNLKLLPLNLPPQHPLRKSFQRHFLHLNDIQLQEYWIKQHYLGKRPPKVLKTEKSMLEFIRNIDGAIGYVSKQTLNNQPLHVLYEWSD